MNQTTSIKPLPWTARPDRIWMAMIGLFFVLTNQWFSWDQGISYMFKQDVGEYAEIAEAAPHLPSHYRLPYHLSQRLALPYVSGTLSKIVGVHYSIFYWFFALVFGLTIIVSFEKTLSALGVRSRVRILSLALLILNPYTLRFYAIVPGMSQDILFVAGSSVALLGLVRARFSTVILGCLLAGLGRQTSVMLMPGVTLWMIFGRSWREHPLSKRLLQAAGVCAAIVGLYLLLGWIASLFSVASVNVTHLVGFKKWYQDDEKFWYYLIEFIVRLGVPYALPLAALTGFYLGQKKSDQWRSPPLEFWACLTLTFFICLQPFLAGWRVTGLSASRLTAIGVLPMLLGIAILFERASELFERRTYTFDLRACLVLVAAGSFHHLYTRVGQGTASGFIATQLALAVGMTTLMAHASTSAWAPPIWMDLANLVARGARSLGALFAGPLWIFNVFFFGLASYSKEFAYLHLQLGPLPIYVGELALLGVLIVAYRRRALILERTPPLLLKIFAVFLTWGLAQLGRSLWVYHSGGFSPDVTLIQVLRDSALIYQSLWILFALSLEEGEWKQFLTASLLGVSLDVLSQWKGFLFYGTISGKEVTNFSSAPSNETISALFPFAAAIWSPAVFPFYLAAFGNTLLSQLLFYFKKIWYFSFLLFSLPGTVLFWKINRLPVRLYAKRFALGILAGLSISMLSDLWIGARTSTSFVDLVMNPTAGRTPRFVHDEFEYDPKRGMVMMQWRLFLWKHAIEDIRLAPLAGHGFGPPIVRKVLWGEVELGGRRISGPHNTFLTVLFRVGLIGFALFAGMLAYALKLWFAHRLRSRWGTLALSALLSISMYGFFNICLENPQNGIWFWIFLGACYRFLGPKAEQSVP